MAEGLFHHADLVVAKHDTIVRQIDDCLPLQAVVGHRKRVNGGRVVAAFAPGTFVHGDAADHRISQPCQEIRCQCHEIVAESLGQ